MVDQYYEDMRDDIKEAQSHKWALKKWISQPALFDKSGKYATPYSGQDFDSEQFHIVEDGWDHDHCRFCWATFCDNENHEHFHEAYHLECGWVCPDCFQHLIINSEDPEIYLGH
ncbi:MAG: hypothetical protein ISS71_00440 [Phycisphaerae bacterium]|nr:hypothetical protein [Phycisphaerae bacterium]